MARLTLGKLYEHYGDLKTAEMHYKIALRERPNYAYALAALGNLERKKGNFAEAEKLLTSATNFIDDASFHEKIADVHRDQGFAERAKEDYMAALKRMENAQDGEDAHSHEHLDGQGHDHIHDAEGHGHEHGLEIANLYLKIGMDKLPEAMENAKLEYGRRPNNIDVNKSLAMIYYHKGEMAKAGEHLQKAMATNSKDPELKSLLGLIAIKSGDKATGKKLIKESMAVNPHQESSVAAEAEKQIS